MSDCRVQKLLFSEFCDFDDMVLIESPFAQTTKDGTGIRQVHLGLTPTKLVLATDILPPVNENYIEYVPGIDPEIETFELIAIYPVTCVNLSVYRRKRRQALKARFCNNKVLYFELGGFQRRNMFWNLWCEKVKFLSPESQNSSKSETSVATSTTASSLYLVDKKIIAKNGMKQLWCKFGATDRGIDKNKLSVVFGNNTQQSSILLENKWSDKYLYLGANFQESPLDYRPIIYKPEYDNIISYAPDQRLLSNVNSFTDKSMTIGDTLQVNRFGNGTSEGCKYCLYLPPQHYDSALRYNGTCENGINVEGTILNEDITSREKTIMFFLDSSIYLWEKNKYDPEKMKIRHRRRYGFCPQPFFLYGLGDCTVNPGSSSTLHLKRVSSDVHIRQSPQKVGLKLSTPETQLVASVSSIQLVNNETGCNRYSNSLYYHKKPIIFFWTTNYCYRPKLIKEAYYELRMRVKKIINYIESIPAKKSNISKRKRKFFKKFHSKSIDKESDEEEFYIFSDEKSYRNRNRKIMPARSERVALCCWPRSITDPDELRSETRLQHIRRILTMDIIVSAWDFDSTTLAEQLTIIDKDLFIKIPPEELDVILWKRTTKYTPNVSTMIAFSYRISCLICCEILRNDNEKMRAKLIARFINVADKCHKYCNFHSCKTILNGLQNPSIYRLQETWAYLRKKHATKYMLFQTLCRLYRDPRLLNYQRMCFFMSHQAPYLPYIGDIIAKLLDKVPEYDICINKKRFYCHSCSTLDSYSKTSHLSRRSKSLENLDANYLTTKVLTKIMNIFNLTATSNYPEKNPEMKQQCNRKVHRRKMIKLTCLDNFMKPLYVMEDNRIKCLAEVTEFLERGQIAAINYCFCPNELAKNYLLKARYSEDRDNFVKSLHTEPSTLAQK